MDMCKTLKVACYGDLPLGMKKTAEPETNNRKCHCHHRNHNYPSGRVGPELTTELWSLRCCERIAYTVVKAGWSNSCFNETTGWRKSQKIGQEKNNKKGQE